MPPDTARDRPTSRAVVVVPTYDEAENLPLIVPAILAQDDRLEVLVVDDNSPDGTGKLADELAEANPGRVHVLHRELKEGLGDGATWLEGRSYGRTLRTAYGPFVQILRELLGLADADTGLVARTKLRAALR